MVVGLAPSASAGIRSENWGQVEGRKRGEVTEPFNRVICGDSSFYMEQCEVALPCTLEGDRCGGEAVRYK